MILKIKKRSAVGIRKNPIRLLETIVLLNFIVRQNEASTDENYKCGGANCIKGEISASKTTQYILWELSLYIQKKKNVVLCTSTSKIESWHIHFAIIWKLLPINTIQRQSVEITFFYFYICAQHSYFNEPLTPYQNPFIPVHFYGWNLSERTTAHLSQ